MKVIILAAGYAVRLQPLTLNTPKPLLAVGGKTILDRIMDRVADVRKASAIYIVSNEKFFKNFKDWQSGSNLKDNISVINDGSISNETRLGAIKDLELVITRNKIDDDILVIAGDNLFDLDLVKFLKFAAAKPDGVSVAVHDIGSAELAKNFGVVKVDAKHKVVDFEEKPQNPKSTLIATGIYYFPRSKLSNILEYIKLQSKHDAPGYYISWLSKRNMVYGFKFSEDWYDIGNIESYEKANEKYSKRKRR